MTTTPPDFDTNFRSKFHDLLIWRRDVRRFRTDPLPSDTLTRLTDAARLAPSVGLVWLSPLVPVGRELMSSVGSTGPAPSLQWNKRMDSSQ